MRLKGLGLAIDDFGTGYSSLEALQRMPFSTIKIDRVFVAARTQSDDLLAIVRSIVELAQALGLATIAEDVEDAAIADRLADMGVGGLQGYLFSPPLPVEAFVAWLTERAHQ